MKKTYKTSIFIFRRDLRLFDNTALIEALTESEKVMPIFILDSRIMTKNRNSNVIQFMIESLIDLDNQLKQMNGRLIVFYGKPEKIIEEIASKYEINAVFVNRDYTPFSQKRDSRISKVCKSKDIVFHQFDDYLLNNPSEVFTAKNKPYVIFTPYYRKASQIYVKYPRKNKNTNYFLEELENEVKIENLYSYMEKENPEIAVKGGINNCLLILRKLTKFKNYDYERDFPALDKTTHLSAYLKFGICSIREVYHAIKTQLGEDHPLIRQLYWRDFFTQVGYHFPRVYSKSFREKYDNLEWEDNKEAFKAWCEGKTGFPIVDAGMRELNTTGYMHNRVRMIVASFLTKDLHIDWRKGEQYFADKLVDFDISVNNGNWQWAASTGCDAQPYFRIFNPWTQQKKYDSECKYIKNWIPELRDEENKTIHTWYKTEKREERNYPKPIVKHSIEREKSKELYIAVNK